MGVSASGHTRVLLRLSTLLIRSENLDVNAQRGR